MFQNFLSKTSECFYLKRPIIGIVNFSFPDPIKYHITSCQQEEGLRGNINSFLLWMSWDSGGVESAKGQNIGLYKQSKSISSHLRSRHFVQWIQRWQNSNTDVNLGDCFVPVKSLFTEIGAKRTWLWWAMGWNYGGLYGGK